MKIKDFKKYLVVLCIVLLQSYYISYNLKTKEMYLQSSVCNLRQQAGLLLCIMLSLDGATVLPVGLI